MNRRPDSVSEKLFFRELLVRKGTVDYYKDEALLEYATEFVPIEELKIKAALWLSMQPDDCGLDLDDGVLLELLRWFKESFFKWMDAPRCTHCNVVTQNKGGVLAPTEEEIEWGASKVEHFACPVCERIYRFPRYNHPKKLLETRQGRCGEWANCFTFLCVALEFDARLVFDWTDHAWTEVYSESQKRWIHCDPCENVCDRPLMYEAGWNKKLSYVIAFSDKEVQDVTWRYTANFKDVLERRTLCREDFLLDSIVFLQEKLAENLPRKEQKLLISRRARELAEFLSPPKSDGENSCGGRTSGSLAWRVARGEAGPAHCQTSYVFKLSPEEIQQRLLRVQYSCTLDRYVRNGEESTLPGGWTACAFRHTNVFRKVESDWKMVYLARTDGSERGNVAWKFDFRESGLVIHKIKLNLCSETFESGKVEWLMHADSGKPLMKVYPPESVRCLETVDFSGSKGFVLSATLSSGTSWQHSQLFRQPLDSRTFPFDVEVHFSTNK